MRSTVLLGVVAIGCATMWSCGGGAMLSPSSAVSPSSALASQAGANTRVHTLADGYDDPYPEPGPAPGPTPDPGTGPAPGPDPAPDPGLGPTPGPAPAPAAFTIGIIGSFGPAAFTPNPVMASLGDQIVFANSDRTRHRIVLDDGTLTGTLVADVGPGESSRPVALTTATVAYHCTIHPSMVGTIGSLITPDPTAPPADGPQPPAMGPAPGMPAEPSAPPSDDAYGYYRLHPR